MIISAIVLAAGCARRMGRTKQLLTLEGKPLLQHVLDPLLASQVDEVILVLGHDADKIEKAISKGKGKVVMNPDFREGMSTSIRQGILALAPDTQGFFICLGDQPGIGKAVINRLIKEFERHYPEKNIIVPAYRGSRGHPVLFSMKYRKEALELTGDIGCRALLAKHPDDLLAVEVDTEAVLADIDSPEDLHRMRSRKSLKERQ